MGTNTDFYGALRIQPQLATDLAARMEDFVSIRHMRRSESELEKLYPTVEERRPRSLLGDGNFGPEGSFFLPVECRDLYFQVEEGGEVRVEGFDCLLDINVPPKECPSLYCDLELVQSPKENCTYLLWSQEEKTYYFTEWIELIARLLDPLGYKLDGQIFACVEGGLSFYTITVKDSVVESEEFEIPCTYWDEVQQARDDNMERGMNNE